ncbi:MAG: N-acetyltransferase [Propionibacteriales bacterium]|nr:N-acetyltransferase [Propionibacteriales bacterium]
MSDVDVRTVPARSRYEAYVDGRLVGYSDYHERDGVISFTHAEVEPAFGGRGIASEMARVSLDDVRAAGGHTVRPACPFYVWFIERHPEYADLVAGRDR